METDNLEGQLVVVPDNGLFIHVARKFAEHGADVKYWTPYVNAFPKSNATLAGDGIEGIDRVLSTEQFEGKGALWVFPDVMFGPMQLRLVKQGELVWGGRMGEDLELDRWETKKLLKSWNMPLNESHYIVGMDALRRFLQAMEKRGPWWIKTSRYRGDFETFKSENYEDVETKLDQIEADLGKKKVIYPFIVERNITAVSELGYDGYTVDGQFPGPDDLAMFGCEIKDTGYIGVAKRYGDFPAPVIWVNEMLAPYFKAKGYRGFFSSEVRCANENQFADGEPESFEDFPVLWNRGVKVPGSDFWAFLIDPCCRMASPPGEAYIEWNTNWPEVIRRGAKGQFVPAQPGWKYAVEIMLHSAFADRNWQPVRFAPELDQWVKLRNCCVIDGVHYSVPQGYGLPEVGAVIALDDDLLTAARTCIERSCEVHGYFMEAKHDAVAKAIIELNNAQEEGIPFTDEPLPTAEELEELQPAD